MEKPLRILSIVNLPWDARLGAASVWIELTEQWEKAGHHVEKFCLTDAFPRPTASRPLAALRESFFPRHAASYVRRNADRFDVIDCLIGTLPFPKKTLRFDGLLVARSVGLYHAYERFLRFARPRWPNEPRGRLLGRLLRRFTARRLKRNSDRSVLVCDLVNLPNEDEKKSLSEIAPGKPSLVLPYGLNERARTEFAKAVRPVEERLEGKEISFIGMWSLRKGSRDWAAIIREIRRQIPEARFNFLGTMVNEEIVYADLGLSRHDGVRSIATYDRAELPALLGGCALGLFPSYIEGFGLAVIEQLACGLPVLAYDVAGPRQILESERALFLTPEGDVKTMAARAVQILRMNLAEYSQLSERCRALAGEYRWEQIATDTARNYAAALEGRRDRPPGTELDAV